jgi:hypothetical protein
LILVAIFSVTNINPSSSSFSSQKKKKHKHHSSKADENCTTVTEFMLLRLSDSPELRDFLFFMFLLIYGVTVLSNLGTITFINSSQLSALYSHVLLS